MADSPNRGGPGEASNPTPEAIKAARAAVGLTQTQAAALIFGTMRAWQQYESGERRMHPGLWALFQIKTKGKK